MMEINRECTELVLYHQTQLGHSGEHESYPSRHQMADGLLMPWLARSNFFRRESADSPKCSAAVSSGSQGSDFEEEVVEATFLYTPT